MKRVFFLVLFCCILWHLTACSNVASPTEPVDVFDITMPCVQVSDGDVVKEQKLGIRIIATQREKNTDDAIPKFDCTIQLTDGDSVIIDDRGSLLGVGDPNDTSAPYWITGYVFCIKDATFDQCNLWVSADLNAFVMQLSNSKALYVGSTDSNFDPESTMKQFENAMK